MLFTTFFDIFAQRDNIMKKNTPKITIAYLKDIPLETICERHILSFSDGKRKPSKTILMHKYQYLLHVIITRCKQSDEGHCHLNAQFYRDHIFHDHWNDMLLNLSYLGIINIGTYSVGKHSTTITLMKWNVGYMTSHNVKFIKWARVEADRRKMFEQVEVTPFTRKYMESLTCLRLTRKDDALVYIDETIADKQTHSYQYHRSCIDDFKESDIRIYKIDEQGRIYHHLTSLPRSLREFFNIKYELDISNSHPLLLNHYLVKYYSIPSNTIREAKAQYHYDVEVVSNILKHNEIDVPLDVLEYIIKTQRGTFYDDFVSEFGDMERSEVKKRVFAQVFYSHITDSYVSKFCKSFIRKYPNVWKVIRAMKVSTDDKLPHTMMKAESLLFRLILKECWSRGYRVVNLHDALVVFDVEANECVTVAELTTIIEQVYHRFGLFPSVKVELGA